MANITSPSIGSTNWGTAVNNNWAMLSRIPGSDDANVQTLSGDLTLTDSSPALQFLDPDGSPGVVTLPLEASTNPQFVIVNTGGSASDVLLVETDAGGFVTLLEAAQGLRCWSDGSTWFSHVVSLAPPAEGSTQVLPFNGDANATGRYYMVNGSPQTSASSTTLSGSTECTIRQAGDIDRLSWNTQTSSGTHDVQIWKNGSTSGLPVTVSNGVGSTSVSLSVAQADQVALEFDADTDPNNSSHLLHLTATGGPTAAAYPFGGSLSTASHYAACMGTGSESTSAALNLNGELAIIANGAALLLAYNTTSGDSTTVFKIWKNGAATESVTATGDHGVDHLASAFEATDEIALEYDSGTAPGASNFTIDVLLSAEPCTIYCFGNEPDTSPLSFFHPYGLPSDFTNERYANYDTELTILVAGQAEKVAVNSKSYGVLNGPSLYKNGSSSEDIGVNASPIVVELSTSYAADDEMAIREDSSYPVEDASFLVLVR